MPETQQDDAASLLAHFAGDEGGGKLPANVVHFGRALRAAGLPVGPGRVLQAIRALECIDITNRQDFYWALHAVFVNRSDQRHLFAQAFQIFWRNPNLMQQMLSLMLPNMRAPEPEEEPPPVSRRVAEALQSQQRPQDALETEEIELDAAMTWSSTELLNQMDFEQMSAAEIEAAKAAIARMRLSVTEVPTRRFQPHGRGTRADMRATLRAALRSGSDTIPLKRKRRRRRLPPLVVLCDISGSMERYSRLLLHFLHVLSSDRYRVYSFLFGTRLTNITRYLRHKDIDLALEQVAAAVPDWSGGTRIGACLHEFNQDWSRRVLGQGAIVLLITDGLDRDAAAGLTREIERLHKSCRRLIWLNPLLRYAGFRPKSLGNRAILPHVDEFRPVHNLESLAALAGALSRPIAGADSDLQRWQRLAEDNDGETQ
jgi:uncharacterized protein with von Willebrand factor type A (vWA) domain